MHRQRHSGWGPPPLIPQSNLVLSGLCDPNIPPTPPVLPGPELPAGLLVTLVAEEEQGAFFLSGSDILSWRKLDWGANARVTNQGNLSRLFPPVFIYNLLPIYLHIDLLTSFWDIYFWNVLFLCLLVILQNGKIKTCFTACGEDLSDHRQLGAFTTVHGQFCSLQQRKANATKKKKKTTKQTEFPYCKSSYWSSEQVKNLPNLTIHLRR